MKLHGKMRMKAVMLAQFLVLAVASFCMADTLSPIGDHRQQQSNWCWAACSESVMNYYGVASTQCSMANLAFTQATCCTNIVWPDGTGAACNNGNYLEDLPALSKRGVGTMLRVFGNLESAYTPWGLSTAEIADDIKAKRPFVMGWYWTGGGGHALAGYGIDTSTADNFVTYWDPWQDPDPAKDGGLHIRPYTFVKSGPGHNWGATQELTTKGITFVIDDTGSMGTNIFYAKAAAKKVLADNKAAKKHYLYTLLSFKDGEPMLHGQTLDPDVMSPLIDALSADGGWGCPESSLLSVRRAAELVKNSEIYLMTDADSNSYGIDDTYATVGEVIETAVSLITNKARLHSIIYSDCSGAVSPITGTITGAPLQNGQTCAPAAASKALATELLTPIDSGKSGYEYVSKNTGGLYFNIASTDTAKATDTILKYAGANATIALYDGILIAGDLPKSYTIPVDSSISLLKIVLNTQTGSANTLTVSKGGTVVDGTTPGVTVEDFGGNISYLIDTPALATGAWKADVGGIGTYRISAVGTTTNPMNYTGDTAIGKGGTLKMRTDIQDAVGGLKFEIVTTDGATAETVTLYDDGAHEDGYANDLYFAGTKLISTINSYRFRASGDGSFQRMYESLIKVGSVSVVAPVGQNVAPGLSVVYTFAVSNVGVAEDTYDLYVASTKGWADLVGIPAQITVPAGGSTNVTVTVNVPAAAALGDYDVVSFKAVSHGDPLINATGLVRTDASVAMPPSAPTSVTAVAGNGQATVSFSPPASDGGSPITNYTATANPEGITGTAASSPITVGGLTNGVPYTFTVTATNDSGTGPASAQSNTVIPLACDYNISISGKSMKSTGGFVSVKVSATGQAVCPAPPVYETYDWIELSGTPKWSKNKGTVKLAVLNNPSSQARTGTVLIGGENLAINQGGAMCKLTALTPPSGSYPGTAGAGTFSVTVSPQDCRWDVTTAFDWIHLDTLTGTGDGPVGFHFDANAAGKSRTGKVNISLTDNPVKKKVFTLKQDK